MPAEDITRFRSVFGADAQGYHNSRVTYPQEIYDRIAEYHSLLTNARILEVGCGTGIATFELAKRGYRVTALDIDANMISQARENLKKGGVEGRVEFIESSLENVDLPSSHYDLVASAQAFHWIEPTIAYRKVHGAIKPNGGIALWWSYDTRKDIIERVRATFSRYCPDVKHRRMSEAVDLTTAYVASSGLFCNAAREEHYKEFEWKIENYVNFVRSLSWTAALAAEQKEAFFSEIGEMLKEFELPLKMRFKTVLILAKAVKQS